MKRIVFPLCVFFLFAGLDAHAESARVEGSTSCYTSEPVCFFSMLIKGEIDLSTVNKVREVLDQRQAWIQSKLEGEAKREEGMIIIDSPGGDLAAAMEIGRILRKERATLFVPMRHICVSACVMVLAGAVKRIYGGKIGIHRPYFETSRGTRPSTPDEVRTSYQKMLQEMRNYLREMTVSERLADDMLAIDPADVRYLSVNQLYEYGLRFVDPIDQETTDLQEAQRWGLNRSEYMRRKALEKTNCNYNMFKKQMGHEPTELETDQFFLNGADACYQRVMKLGR